MTLELVFIRNVLFHEVGLALIGFVRIIQSTDDELVCTAFELFCLCTIAAITVKISVRFSLRPIT